MAWKTSKIITTGLLFVSLLLIAGCGSSNVGSPTVVGNEPQLRRPTTTVPPYVPPTTWTPSHSVKGKTFIIDPGHGGKDPGAKGLSPMAEKEINIDTALKLASILKSKGARVVMTRSSDNFIELDDRAAMAERYNADALISIHADWCGTPSISGASFYIARAASSQSRKLAESLDRAFRNASIDTRGVKQADFRVLAKHSKPSTLIELGYLSNQSEASDLNSSSYRATLASIIAKGIENAY